MIWRPEKNRKKRNLRLAQSILSKCCGMIPVCSRSKWTKEGQTESEVTKAHVVRFHRRAKLTQIAENLNVDYNKRVSKHRHVTANSIATDWSECPRRPSFR